MDPRTGRWAAGNLAEYLVPVNADAPDVTVEFVDVHDEVVDPLGVKGVGEIGQVGVAAAIANAVFHATGRRVRRAPDRAELVMDPARMSALPARPPISAPVQEGGGSVAVGVRGLWLVVPIAVLLAVGAGGPEESVLDPRAARDVRVAAGRDGGVLVGGLAGHAARAELVRLGGHGADRGRRRGAGGRRSMGRGWHRPPRRCSTRRRVPGTCRRSRRRFRWRGRCSS